MIREEKVEKFNLSNVDAENSDGVNLNTCHSNLAQTLLYSEDGSFIISGRVVLGLGVGDHKRGIRRGQEATIKRINYYRFRQDPELKGREYSITFQQYIELGRPRRITVRELTEISPQIINSDHR